MVRWLVKLYPLLALSLLLVSSLAAQDSEAPSRGPDGGTQVHVDGIKILPVAGKPFSGVDSVDWTRNLADGTTVATHLNAKLARDSQGRIYRERVSFVPLNSNQQPKPREIFLLDPVTHTRTVCVVAARRCTVTGYRAPTLFKNHPRMARLTMGHDSLPARAWGPASSMVLTSWAHAKPRPSTPA